MKLSVTQRYDEIKTKQHLRHTPKYTMFFSALAMAFGLYALSLRNWVLGLLGILDAVNVGLALMRPHTYPYIFTKKSLYSQRAMVIFGFLCSGGAIGLNGHGIAHIWNAYVHAVQK